MGVGAPPRVPDTRRSSARRVLGVVAGATGIIGCAVWGVFVGLPAMAAAPGLLMGAGWLAFAWRAYRSAVRERRGFDAWVAARVARGVPRLERYVNAQD